MDELITLLNQVTFDPQTYLEAQKIARGLSNEKPRIEHLQVMQERIFEQARELEKIKTIYQ